MFWFHSSYSQQVSIQIWCTFVTARLVPGYYFLFHQCSCRVSVWDPSRSSWLLFPCGILWLVLDVEQARILRHLSWLLCWCYILSSRIISHGEIFLLQLFVFSLAFFSLLSHSFFFVCGSWRSPVSLNASVSGSFLAFDLSINSVLDFSWGALFYESAFLYCALWSMHLLSSGLVLELHSEFTNTVSCLICVQTVTKR